MKVLVSLITLLALAPSQTFAGDGTESGGVNVVVKPPVYNDSGVENTTPGYFFDDPDDSSASHEWNIASAKAGDRILCARSYDDDTRATGTYRDSFCIAHDAPEYALKIGPQGVGIGTFNPIADLTISDVSGDSNPTLWMNGPNGGWMFQTIVTGNASDSSDEVFVFGTSSTNYPLLITENATGTLALAGPNIVVGGSDAGANLGVGVAWDTTEIDYVKEAVDVVRDEAAARFQLTSYTDNGSEAPQYIQRRAKGSFAAPQAINNGENIGIFSFRGHTGSGFTGSKAGIFVQASENWSTTGNGTKIKFYTTANGGTSLSEAMEITHDGHIKVGGTQLNVPDYVFEEDYELMSLEDLDAYVKEQHHLPDVPSEATIRAEGLNVTKTQMLLLKKIEELTLYAIQQQKQFRKQQNQFLQQKEEIKRLKQIVVALSVPSAN